MTGGITREEHVVLGGTAQLVGYPVALIAMRGQVEIIGEPHGGLLDVVRWPEGADSHAHLIVSGEAPAIAGADIASIDPQLHLLAGALGVDLQAARESSVWWLDRRAVREDSPPAEPVDDKWGAQLTAVGVDGVAIAARNGGGLELDLRRRGLVPQTRAQLAVVEC